MRAIVWSAPTSSDCNASTALNERFAPDDATAADTLKRASPAFGYNSALDGLRALAVAGVVLGHAGVRGLAGHHGVTLFFVISGYLITSLLIAERERTGVIRFGNFYLRRLARLGPAMVLVVVVTVAWLFAIRFPWQDYWLGVVGTLTYTMDLIQVLWGNDAVSSYFQWSWSLGIEEQFYLIWPLLLLLLINRVSVRTTLAVLLATVVLVWVARYTQNALGTTHEAGFYGPLSHADGLILGAMLAILLMVARDRARLLRIARVLGPIGLIGLAVVFAFPRGLPIVRLADPSGFGQTAVVSLMVIFWVAVSPKGWLGRVLSTRPLVFLGRLSYGIYLWNLLLVDVFVYFVGVKPVASWWGLLYPVALVGVCYLSFRFVETPLRQRWAPAHHHAVLVGSRTHPSWFRASQPRQSVGEVSPTVS